MARMGLVGGSQVVSQWRMGWKGTGRREVKSENKASWLWFSGGRV
jgi:hypothetical protein